MLGMRLSAATRLLAAEQAVEPPSDRFTDDFNRPDENLSASPDWTLVNGSASDARIDGNGLRSGTASSTGSLHLAPATPSTAHYAEVRFLESTGALVVVRAVDANNCIGVRFRLGNLELYRRVNGSLLLVKREPVTAGVHARLEAEGTQVRIYQGAPGAWTGIGAYSVTNSVLQTSTRCGYIARFAVESGPVYDNFACGPLTDGSR